MSVYTCAGEYGSRRRARIVFGGVGLLLAPGARFGKAERSQGRRVVVEIKRIERVMAVGLGIGKSWDRRSGDGEVEGAGGGTLVHKAMRLAPRRPVCAGRRRAIFGVKKRAVAGCCPRSERVMVMRVVKVW